MTIDNKYEKERAGGVLVASDSFLNSDNLSLKLLGSNQIEPDSLEVEMRDENLARQRSD